MVVELCCTAMLEPWAAEDSSYWMTRQEEGVWPVQGASWDQGWGWQTEEGYGKEDRSMEAWATAAGPERMGRKWVVGLADRS